jgi:outer membrane usher protein
LWPRHDAPRAAVAARLLDATPLLGALLSLTIAAKPVHAQSTTTALLEVVVDGQSAGVVLPFRMIDGVPHASLADWRRSGVRLPGTFEPQAPDAVGLFDLPGVRGHVNPSTQTLHVQLSPDLTGLTLIGGAGAQPPSELPREVGAVLNYDAIVERTGGDRTAAPSRRGLLLDGWVFGPLGVFEHSVVVGSAVASRGLRLNSSFTRVEPEQLRRFRVGDLVSGGLAWSRPVRLAGLQVAKDFGLRPDLFTAPLPDLSGSVVVPSTVDVLVDGVRQWSQPVEPGRFELRQGPQVSGAGDISVVVRDALGRESVQSLPFYAAPQQLAAGLSEFSVEAGRLRRNFGRVSDDYGPLAALGTWRHGWTSALTLEVHAEHGPGSTSAGASGVWVLPRLGRLGVQSAASRGEGRNGLQAGVSAERQSSNGHVAMVFSRASAGYRDLAATQGEPVPQRVWRLSAGWTLGRYGNLGLAWFDATASHVAPQGVPLAPMRSLRVATGSYSVAVTPTLQALFSAFRSATGADRSRGIAVHVSLPLDDRVLVNASMLREGRSVVMHASAHRPAQGRGELGWRVEAGQALVGDVPAHAQADVDYQAPIARVEASVQRSGGTNATRVSAQGALVAMAGGVQAAPPASGSVAVIELAETPGVAVYRENRLVGRTDRRGRLVITDLPPYQASRISIEPLDMPLDTDVATLVQQVRPVEHTGVAVRFGVERRRSAVVMLVDAQGHELPLGAAATLNRADKQVPIGHDGLAYLRDLADDNQLAVAWSGGAQRCNARFTLAERDWRTGRIGPLICR